MKSLLHDRFGKPRTSVEAHDLRRRRARQLRRKWRLFCSPGHPGEIVAGIHSNGYDVGNVLVVFSVEADNPLHITQSRPDSGLGLCTRIMQVDFFREGTGGC